MPTTPQAKNVANEKIRPAADKLSQAYNYFKMLQGEAQAENWTAMFASGAEVVVDGSETDGRTPMTHTDVLSFMTMVTSFITFMEQSSNANRNLALKIAVNPERV